MYLIFSKIIISKLTKKWKWKFLFVKNIQSKSQAWCMLQPMNCLFCWHDKFVEQILIIPCWLVSAVQHNFMPDLTARKIGMISQIISSSGIKTGTLDWSTAYVVCSMIQKSLTSHTFYGIIKMKKSISAYKMQPQIFHLC